MLHMLGWLIITFGVSTSTGTEGGLIVDTVRVSSPMLIVYGCSQAERDSLARDENSGVDEVLSDFFTYLGEMHSWLDSNSVTVYETSAEKFLVIVEGKCVLTYERKAHNDLVGCVLVRRGKAPTILPGVLLDYEYRQELQNYYAGKSRSSKAH